jgi:DNA-directed RNA polymerase subunit RPC12/RpoP
MDDPEAPAPGPAEAKSFECPKCGGKLQYDAGSGAQKCPFCGHEIAIARSEEDIRELDFREYLERMSAEADVQERTVVKCRGCGAETTFDPNVTADRCAFCAGPIVREGASSRLIRPKALLPFKVTRDAAHQSFRDWLRGLWFAPGSLREYARREQPIEGVYLPYWTYDAETMSFYRGERGDDYRVTETFRKSDGSTGTRTVTKTRWTSVSGTVWRNFDDVTVLATRSVPSPYAERLEPWDLENLEPYRDEFLSGFRAESYQLDLAGGFEEARKIMDETIRGDVCRDIGGDHQRIHSVRTQYDGVTFKHVLLPVWVSAYRYRARVYRFLVNGRSGEVQGERPWSWAKIGLLVLGILGLAALLLWFLSTR